jgi:hypothetical protein
MPSLGYELPRSLLLGTSVKKDKKKGRSPERGTRPDACLPGSEGGRSGYLAEDEDLFLKVPVDGLGVVDKVAQNLRVVGGGHDEGLLGPVVEDELVGELAVLEVSLVAPVGVDVGDLPDLYRSLGVLLAQGWPPRVGVVDGGFLPARHLG